MYSMWVSSWRVPLMNVTAEISSQAPCRRGGAARRGDLLGAAPVLNRHPRRARPMPLEPGESGVELGGLRRDDHELGLRQDGRIGRRGDGGLELVGGRGAGGGA